MSGLMNRVECRRESPLKAAAKGCVAGIDDCFALKTLGLSAQPAAMLNAIVITPKSFALRRPGTVEREIAGTSYALHLFF